MLTRIASLCITLLTPGLVLMRRMRLPAKLTLLTGVMLVPLVVLMALVVRQSLAEMDDLQRKMDGSVLAERLVKLGRTMQRERGLVYRYKRGDHSTQEALEAQTARLRLVLGETE